MGQVTIYLDDTLEAKMKLAAKEMQLSQSKWIATLIEEKVSDSWPESIKSLAGAWKDFPTLEEIRKNSQPDIPREEF